jgi:tetratricopeptide (TPR) repeat protein
MRECLLKEIAEYLDISVESLLERHDNYLSYQLLKWEGINPEDNDMLLSFYNDNLYLYELIADSNFGIVYLIEPFLEKQERILDYGSGIGTHGLYFLKKGYNVTFADIPSPHFEFIKWYAKKYGFKADFIELSRDAVVDLKKIDAILCFDVLEHLLNWKQTIQQFFDTLTHNGKLFLIVSFREFENSSLHIGKLSGLNEKSYNDFMRDTGFIKTFKREQPLSLTHPKEALELFQKYRDDRYEKLSNLFEEGILNKTHKKYATAKNCFNELLKWNHNDFGSMFNLAEISIAENNFIAAMNYLKKNLELIPDDFKAIGKLADTEIALGNYEDAVIKLITAITIRPNLSGEIKRRLYYLHSQGINIPLSFYENADWRTQLHIASFFVEYKLFDAAKNLLNSLVPKNSVATRAGLMFRKELARYYREHGEYHLSVQMLKHLIEQWPKEIWLNFDIALAYRDSRDIKKAFEYLQKELDISPFKSVIYANLGILYRMQKDYEKSLSMLDRALELMPEYGEGFYERAITYIEIKNYENAIEDLNTAKSFMPDNGMIYLHRAIAYRGRKEYDDALRDLDLAESLMPMHLGSVYYERAITYSMYGNYDMAIKNFCAAESFMPGNSYLYFEKGTAFRNAGKLLTAIKYFEKAFELNPHEMWSRYTLKLKLCLIAAYAVKLKLTRLLKKLGNKR